MLTIKKFNFRKMKWHENAIRSVKPHQDKKTEQKDIKITYI
jgi:hypothetical protein